MRLAVSYLPNPPLSSPLGLTWMQLASTIVLRRRPWLQALLHKLSYLLGYFVDSNKGLLQTLHGLKVTSKYVCTAYCDR